FPDCARGDELGPCRRPLEPRCDLATCSPQAAPRLLLAAWEADRRRTIAEMTLDLPDDCRDRERPEVDAAFRVEPFGRFDETDRADLDEVLEALPPVGVTPCECDDQRQVLLDQAVTS